MKTIPLTISPFFWLVAAIVGFLYTSTLPGTLMWISVVLLSLLVHEYGHGLTARAFGQRVNIRIEPFGGLTLRQGMPLSLGKEFLVVLNGPLAGISLALVSYGLYLFFDPFVAPRLSSICLLLVQVNVFWTLINLLPVGPLDGGQLLRIGLQALFGLRGAQLAYILSILVGLAVGVFFILVNMFLVGALLFVLTFESFRGWRQVLQMSPEDTDTELRELYQTAMGLAGEGRRDEAISILKRVKERSGDGMLSRSCAQVMAAILSDQGYYTEAYQELHSIRTKLDPEGQRLYQQLAYEEGKWQEALDAGTAVYREEPDAIVAILNARVCGQLGDARQAIGWLESAKRSGYMDIGGVIATPDFDSIREHPGLQNLLR